MVFILKADVNSKLDPFQFSYRQGRGTGDAINTLIHLILNHLEDPEVSTASY